MKKYIIECDPNPLDEKGPLTEIFNFVYGIGGDFHLSANLFRKEGIVSEVVALECVEETATAIVLKFPNTKLKEINGPS